MAAVLCVLCAGELTTPGRYCSDCDGLADRERPIVDWLTRHPDPFKPPDNADKYGDPLAGEYEDSEG